jgi:probable phosphoglycerate mutase
VTPDRQRAFWNLIPEGLDATLVLVRHGESEWIREGRFQGQAETPLSALGRQQAALVAARVADAHASPALPVPGGTPREVVHSPLSRAADVARAISDACAARALASGATAPVLHAEPGLLELGQGEWEGVTGEDIARRWPAEISAWRHRPHEAFAPGGESLDHVQMRVRPALARVLNELGRDYPRGTVDRPQVGGYHGVGQASDQPWSVLVAHDGVFKVVMLTLLDLPLDRFWTFSWGLTGVTVLELRGGRPVLRAHNLTGHLAPIEDELARAAAEQRGRSGAL